MAENDISIEQLKGLLVELGGVHEYDDLARLFDDQLL